MQKTVSGDRSAKVKAANRGPGADRPKHDIVADAKAGRPGKLTVPFVSRNPLLRLAEIERVLDSQTLHGLYIKLLLHPDDAAGLPLPERRPDFIAVAERSDVPRGEFHVELTLAH
jgi:hypothetical protein